MKRTFMLLAVLALIFSFVVGCSSQPTGADKPATGDKPAGETSAVDLSKVADGTYHAEEADFSDSGWKYVVEVKVEEGKIVDVTWNGLHKDGGDDKVTASKSGAYGMVEKAGALAEWHEQAETTEKYLIEKQDLTGLEYNEEGKTDAIAGATITVKPFFELVEQALASEPVK